MALYVIINDVRNKIKVWGTFMKCTLLRRGRSLGYPPRPISFRILNLLVGYIPLKKKYCHNSILMRKCLREVASPTDLPRDDEFSTADNMDIDAIMRHPEALPAKIYRKRLAAGDCCYCLRHHGEIIGYNWLSRDTCCILRGFEKGIEFLPLVEGQAFSYDFYVYKNHRRMGVGTAMKRQLLWLLRSQGYNEVFSVVMPNNLVSLKVHFSLGFDAEYMVYGYRIGDWVWTYYDREGDRSRLNSWVARAKAYISPGEGVA